MKLTNKEKQLVREYAKKLQSKKLNEASQYGEIFDSVNENKLNQILEICENVCETLLQSGYSNDEILKFLTLYLKNNIEKMLK